MTLPLRRTTLALWETPSAAFPHGLLCGPLFFCDCERRFF